MSFTYIPFSYFSVSRAISSSDHLKVFDSNPSVLILPRTLGTVLSGKYFSTISGYDILSYTCFNISSS